MYVIFSGAVMSEVYMLKMGERTPPCGMPVLNWRVDVVFLNVA